MYKGSDNKRSSMPKVETIRTALNDGLRKKLHKEQTSIQKEIAEAVKSQFDDKLPQLREQLESVSHELTLLKSPEKVKKESNEKKRGDRIKSAEKKLDTIMKKLDEVNRQAIQRLAPILNDAPSPEEPMPELIDMDNEEPAPVQTRKYKKNTSSTTATAKTVPEISYTCAPKPYEYNGNSYVRSQFARMKLHFNPFSGEKRNRKKNSEAENLFDARVGTNTSSTSKQKKQKTIH